MRPRLFLVLTLVCILRVSHGPAWGADELVKAVHSPRMPRPGQAVRITGETEGAVRQLTLEYQAVEPGAYIARQDPAFQEGWTSVPMSARAGSPTRSVFEAELPGGLQTHRCLIRYRFKGVDARGREFVSPGREEAVPNHAYFVYGGVPAWRAAIHPHGRNAALRRETVFDTNAMTHVQSYHLIARKTAVENVTWNEPSHDNTYRYTATLVVDGVVCDHVRIRARGGVWRFAMGKNMWKFALPKGASFPAKDDYGRPYLVPWDEVNLRACIQQGDYGFRGEQGMFEAVGFRLFNLAGVPAPATHWIQLRMVTDAQEDPGDQYQGDYWGLYLAFEDVDGRFLKAHGLPDGNVYKMEGGGGVPNHLSPGQAGDGSDLGRFLADYGRTSRPEAWWRANLNLSAYYSYRAVCEAIHHYDIGDGKNYFYYRNPDIHRWQVIPWDIDLTWADTMYGTGDEPFYRRVLKHPALRVEYQNRLREIRDLLFNPAETDRLIDECAAVIADPAGGPSPVDADRAKWDYHPVMAMGGKAGQGLFYRAAPSRDFKGMVQWMKSYVRRRGEWIDRTLIRDPQIPQTPALTYHGSPGHPPGDLVFRVSPFSGHGRLASIEWRVGEIAPPVLRSGRPVAPGKYEITAVWEAGSTGSWMRLPDGALLPGRAYRVRARTKDDAGRCSHWSAPVEFVVGSTK